MKTLIFIGGQNHGKLDSNIDRCEKFELRGPQGIIATYEKRPVTINPGGTNITFEAWVLSELGTASASTVALEMYHQNRLTQTLKDQLG